MQLSAHLQQMRAGMKEVQGQIVAALSASAARPQDSYADFGRIVQQVSGLERDHSAWASAYFAEVQELYGVNSEVERQARPMSADVSQWISQMHIWALMGTVESAILLGRLDEARQSAAAGADLCAADTGFTAERAQFLLQLAFVLGKQGALAEAGQYARRAHDAALACSSWVSAAQALSVSAVCALLLDDRQTYASTLASAIELTDAHSGDSQMKDLAAMLRNVRLTVQGALDQTGDTQDEIRKLADSTLRSVMQQIKSHG